MSQKIWDDYFKWYYEANTWKFTYYRGVRTLKLPSDMWNYQEILFEHAIDNVIETGTRHGGSALYFSDMLSVRNPNGRVYSIDIDEKDRAFSNHPNIHFLIGSSADPAAVTKVSEMMGENRGKVMLMLDSDHSCDHVLKELELWVPFLKPGDYLIVEDGCVNGHPVRKEHGPGPWEAVEEFLQRHPDVLLHDKVRETKFGATAAPNGYFIRK